MPKTGDLASEEGYGTSILGLRKSSAKERDLAASPVYAEANDDPILRSRSRDPNREAGDGRRFRRLRRNGGVVGTEPYCDTTLEAACENMATQTFSDTKRNDSSRAPRRRSIPRAEA